MFKFEETIYAQQIKKAIKKFNQGNHKYLSKLCVKFSKDICQPRMKSIGRHILPDKNVKENTLLIYKRETGSPFVVMERHTHSPVEIVERDHVVVPTYYIKNSHYFELYQIREGYLFYIFFLNGAIELCKKENKDVVGVLRTSAENSGNIEENNTVNFNESFQKINKLFPIKNIISHPNVFITTPEKQSLFKELQKKGSASQMTYKFSYEDNIKEGCLDPESLNNYPKVRRWVTESLPEDTVICVGDNVGYMPIREDVTGILDIQPSELKIGVILREEIGIICLEQNIAIIKVKNLEPNKENVVIINTPD